MIDNSLSSGKYMVKVILRVLISFSFCALFFTNSYAQFGNSDNVQTPLFEQAGATTLSSTASERLQTVRQSKKAGKVDVVQLPDDLYNYWQLSFNVDKNSEELLFDQTGIKLVIARTNLEVLSEDKIAWSGDILYGQTKILLVMSP